MIENRNLTAGTRLVANYKKQAFVCTVEAGEDGKLAFVVDGKRYTSPSSAGSAVMGGAACNGWRFWSVESQGAVAKPSPTKATRAPKRADGAPKKRNAGTKPRSKPKAHRFIRPMDNQEDVPEGQVRYWCEACMDAFLGFTGQTPQQCQNGHRVDDPRFSIDEPVILSEGGHRGVRLVDALRLGKTETDEACFVFEVGNNVFQVPLTEENLARVRNGEPWSFHEGELWVPREDGESIPQVVEEAERLLGQLDN